MNAPGKRPPASGGGSPERGVLGRPWVWTRAWTVVVVVWAVVALGLGAVRWQMGEQTAWSARETRAVAQVQEYAPDDAYRCDELLAAVTRSSTDGSRKAVDLARWYAFERPWEGRVYVVWEWGDAALGFVVEEGRVRPDDETRLVLKQAERSLDMR